MTPVIPTDLVQVQPLGRLWGGMLGGTFSQLGNFALGYQPDDYYLATWIAMRPEDYSSELFFGYDEGGNQIASFRFVPIALRRTWIEQAIDTGAIFLLSSNLNRLKILHRAARDQIAISDRSIISSIGVHETAIDSLSMIDHALAGPSPFDRQAIDLLSISESVDRQIMLLVRGSSDAMVLSDSVTLQRIIFESMSISDDAIKGTTGVDPPAFDSMSISDSVSRVLGLSRSFPSESIAISESASRSQNAPRSSSDSVAMSDAAALVLPLSLTGTTTSSGITNGSASVVIPGTASVGDKAYVALGTADNGSGHYPVVPTGWTLEAQTVVLPSGAFLGARISVISKTLVSGDPGSTLNLAPSGGTGFSPGGYPWEIIARTYNTTGTDTSAVGAVNATSLAAPNVTSDAPNQAAVTFIYVDHQLAQITGDTISGAGGSDRTQAVNSNGGFSTMFSADWFFSSSGSSPSGYSIASNAPQPSFAGATILMNHA